ncbi:MAG: GldG family protein [Planctomycetes bacterium]|nr:GldG family protein [Planctomycetota bacterium]
MSRVKIAQRQAAWSAFLLIGITFLTVGLAQKLRWRLDLTSESLYTLSPALVEMLESLEDRLQIKLYFNRDVEGAEHLLQQRLSIQDRLAEIAAIGGDLVSIETVDPTTDLLAARDAEHLGIEAVTITDARIGGVSLEKLYQGLELRYLDRSELIPFVVPDEFEFAFASRLAALLQGDRRPVLGFFSREPLLAPPVPGVDQMASPDRIFEEFREILAGRYAVRDLSSIGVSNPIPDDLAAVVVGRPERVSVDESAALQVYLERGGRILMLVDHEKVNQSMAFATEAIDTGVTNLLDRYGVTVLSHFVWDPECRSVPVDVQVVQGPNGEPIRNPIYAPYGLWAVARGNGLSATHVVTAQLDEADLIWAHPVVYRQTDLALEAEILLRSSAQARALSPEIRLDISRSNVQLIDAQAARQKNVQAFDLAVALRGSFAEGAPEGVLVVIGDTDLFQNPTLQVAASNRKLAQNLIDWLASDESLITLRTRGRTLRPLRDFYAEAFLMAGGVAETEAETRERDKLARQARDRMERWIAWGNVCLPPILLLIAAVAHVSRRRVLAARPYQSGGEC